MNAIASSSSVERMELFLDTIETHQHIHLASLVEKDFWVCWVLSRLFTSDMPVSILFKGGTSLSKAYSVISRLSEDIDLSLDRSDLGITTALDPRTASSNRERNRRLDRIVQESTDYISGVFLDRLNDDFKGILGESKELQEWRLAIDSEDNQVLIFSYPVTEVTPAIGEYVSPFVKLEFGARSDHWPVVNRVITPYAAESFPEAFRTPSCTVPTLSVERSFWEKAVILHGIHHGGVNHLRPRMARHYYDVYCLVSTGHGEEALAQQELLSAVIEHADVFFHRGWAKYDEAGSGSLKLLPSEEMIGPLQRDYLAMESLFIETPPTFSEILTVIKELEDEINRSGD